MQILFKQAKIIPLVNALVIPHGTIIMGIRGRQWARYSNSVYSNLSGSEMRGASANTHHFHDGRSLFCGLAESWDINSYRMFLSQ